MLPDDHAFSSALCACCTQTDRKHRGARYNVPLAEQGHEMGLRAAQLHERRRPDRPQNGDLKLCPRCQIFNCEFNERYRFPDGGVGPAWLCESAGCGFRLFVRATAMASSSEDLIRRTQGVQASAKRRMMKSRSVTERSRKRIAVRRITKSQ